MWRYFKTHAWPWVLLALAAAILVLVASTGRRVRFAQDVELTGASISREVVPGGTLAITLRVKPSHPLDADDWVFIHVESRGGGSNACRMVQDALPSPPPTRWGSQEITHAVEVAVPRSCTPGAFEVYAGLYNRETQARLKVIEPLTGDNRVHAGWTEIVADNPDAELETISPRRMRLQDAWALGRPWAPWLAAIGVACVAAAAIYRRRRAEDDEEDKTSTARPLTAWERRAALAMPAIPFVLGILVVLEFVKDDAYISFRYAHNLVTGHGLVFNWGERLEGYTNFLWVFVMAPFEALGWDLFQVCEVLGTAAGIAVLVLVARFTAWIHGERNDLSHLWGAIWLGACSSFALWEKSGMEQPLASLLPIGGAFLLFRARNGLAHPTSAETRKVLERRYLYAGLVMGAACMTRPELHLLAILVGMPLVVDAVRARRITRADALYVVGILAVTVPCHTFRYLYYGTLVPNTFYVKTGTGPLVWRAGVQTVREMFEFNHLGLLAILAPLAFANRRRLLEKATMALIAASFIAYYVKVGVDEMQWHRLYLPALPFLCVLAALGLQNATDAAVRFVADGPEPGRERLAAYGLAWAAVLLAAWNSFRFTYREVNGFNGHGDLAGTFHPDMGKFLVRHERPGSLVAFQDMGSTPYHAPDINFLDFFGLVDRTVAHARHDYGLHTFLGADVDNMQPKYDAEMREYFFRRNPEWTIFTIYTPQGEEQRLQQLFDRDPTGASFGDAFKDNSVQFALWDDPRFRQRYVPVRTWPRSAAYYLALFRRRDLWEQTPREVVLDAPPPNLGGVAAKVEGGLELLGSEVTARTLERHEAFITTWWKVPGPMPHDLYFFVHITKEGFQTPADHVPGDWMYPADRWLPGQILEDRILFQLPPFTMTPGLYKIYMGVWLRGTDTRLRVLDGPNDGSNRIPLGTLEVKTLYPMIHQLIPPTRLDVMRKYPDRIMDPHRAPGT